MNQVISKNAEELGKAAAQKTAELLNEAIAKQGYARLILSTGASQFTTLSELVKLPVDWSKVDMFHLDEYVGMDESHPASFVRYLKERFVCKIPLRAAHFVDTTKPLDEMIPALTAELREKPIDVGLIGIGENGHIAFNDPPADFDDPNAYKVVTLDAKCRNQQLGEGWFPTIDDVPTHAVSMTVGEIMKCRHIISAVPYAVKAQAVHDTLTQEVNNMVPATIMKTHADWNLFIDEDSASMLK